MNNLEKQKKKATEEPWQLIKPLSFGPGSEVWLAKLNGKKVIAKRYPSSNLPWPLPPDPNVLAKLRHPSIVRFIYSDKDEDEVRTDFFSFKPDAISLKEMLQHGTLPEPTRISIIRSAAYGLRYLHEKSAVGPILHGDIAPSNLIVTPTGKSVWLDVSAFKPETFPLGPGLIWGHPTFMAPEVLNEGPVTIASEVFAFGLLVLCCFVGRLPWSKAVTPQDVLGNLAYQNLSKTVSEAALPEPLDKVAGITLALRPEDRPLMSKVVAVLRNS